MALPLWMPDWLRTPATAVPAAVEPPPPPVTEMAPAVAEAPVPARPAIDRGLAWLSPCPSAWRETTPGRPPGEPDFAGRPVLVLVAGGIPRLFEDLRPADWAKAVEKGRWYWTREGDDAWTLGPASYAQRASRRGAKVPA